MDSSSASQVASAAPFRETKYWKYVLEPVPAAVPVAASTGGRAATGGRLATPPDMAEVVEGKRQRVSPVRLTIEIPTRGSRAANAFKKPQGHAQLFRQPAPQAATPRKTLGGAKAPTPGAERWDPFVVGYDVYVEGSRAWVPSRVL